MGPMFVPHARNGRRGARFVAQQQPRIACRRHLTYYSVCFFLIPMRWPISILVLWCLCGLLPAQQCPTTSKLQMSKGEYDWQPGVAFTLQNFFANLVPKGKTSPQCFIKSTQIQHGRVYVNTQSLTRLFQEKMEEGQQQNGGKNDDAGNKKNNQASDDKNKDQKDQKNDKNDKNKDQKKDDKDGGKDAKDDSKGGSGGQRISDIAIKTKGNELEISGKMKKLMSIPFDLIGPVDVANGHMLRFHVEKIKAAGIESKGLLDALGLHLTKMLHPDAAKGVSVQDNAILFDTEAIANIQGEISRVQVSGDNLVIDFSTPSRRQHPAGAGAGKSAHATGTSSAPSARK